MQLITLQRAGGIAAIAEALLYVIGFSVIATLLNPGSTEEWSQSEKLSFLLERKSFFHAFTILIYVVFGVFLVVLAAAIHEWLKTKAAALMFVATSFGLIWAGLVIASGMVASVGIETVAGLRSLDMTQAALAWVVIGAVQDALGGGVEIVGGLWVLLVSVASHQSNVLPKLLSYLGFGVGLAGILTVAPPFGGLGVVFGLGQIIWFAWIGLRMLRNEAQQVVAADV